MSTKPSKVFRFPIKTFADLIHPKNKKSEELIFAFFIFPVRVFGNDLKTLAEKIRSADEERSTAAFESRIELSRQTAVTVVGETVVVSDVKRRSRIRIPAEQKLPARIFRQSVVIDAKSREKKARELIGRAH